MYICAIHEFTSARERASHPSARWKKLAPSASSACVLLVPPRNYPLSIIKVCVSYNAPPCNYPLSIINYQLLPPTCRDVIVLRLYKKDRGVPESTPLSLFIRCCSVFSVQCSVFNILQRSGRAYY